MEEFLMEEFLMLSLVLNVLAFVAVLVVWLFYRKTEEEEVLEEIQTEIPETGRIILKRNNEEVLSWTYDGLEDFHIKHGALFERVIQRGEDWSIKVVSSLTTIES